MRVREILPPIIGPSWKLRETVRVANSRLPVSYEEAKRQVDRIAEAAGMKPTPSAQPRNRSGF